MIDAGALENVSAIFGLHVNPGLPIGYVASRPGPVLAGSGFFEAVISGKGGHAAIPQHSIDPILAASNVIVSLQHLVSREADPLDSQVPSSFLLCVLHSSCMQLTSSPVTIPNSVLVLHSYFCVRNSKKHNHLIFFCSLLSPLET